MSRCSSQQRDDVDSLVQSSFHMVHDTFRVRLWEGEKDDLMGVAVTCIAWNTILRRQDIRIRRQM